MNFSTLPLLKKHSQLEHAIFNRHGGRSSGPFQTGNVSFGVGDNQENVIKNREKIKKNLNLSVLASAKQVHGDKIVSITKQPGKDLEEDGYDALITNIPKIGLMIQQADCQAVMLFDPAKSVIANIHAGWRGSTINIIKKTIDKMVDEFGSEPSNMVAGISPSLGPCCAEFINYKTELPKRLHKYKINQHHFDFWSISRDQLKERGLKPENIETADICTVCDHDYFSYRRDKITGRFSTVIALK